MQASCERKWQRMRRVIETGALLLFAPPWLACAWLGEVIAETRWSGTAYALSVAAILAALLLGWRACWRLLVRWSDVTVADYLLSAVAPAEPWTLFSPQPEQLVRAEHLHHCQRRWGVSPQSSGWWRLRGQAWRRDAVLVLGCLPLTLHPLWWWWAV